MAPARTVRDADSRRSSARRLPSPGQRVPEFRSSIAFRRLPHIDEPGRDAAMLEHDVLTSFSVRIHAINEIGIVLSPDNAEVRFVVSIKTANAVDVIHIFRRRLAALHAWNRPAHMCEATASNFCRR